MTVVMFENGETNDDANVMNPTTVPSPMIPRAFMNMPKATMLIGRINIKAVESDMDWVLFLFSTR